MPEDLNQDIINQINKYHQQLLEEIFNLTIDRMHMLEMPPMMIESDMVASSELMKPGKIYRPKYNKKPMI